MWRIFLCVICVVSFVSLPSWMTCTDTPTGTVPQYGTVCALMKDTKSISRQTVRVESTLESDGMHGSWLQDDSCGAKILLRTADRARNRRDIRKLEDTIFHGLGRAGTVTKSIHAVFEGNLRRKGKAYVFEMTGVHNVKVTPKAQ